jgi:hypothetical protein
VSVHARKSEIAIALILYFFFFIIQVTSLLNRMQLRAEHSVLDDNKCNINVSVPPTRSDILHPCDVMEVYNNGFYYLLCL